MRVNVGWRNNPMANVYGFCEICGRSNYPGELHCENHYFVDSRDFIDVPMSPTLNREPEATPTNEQ